jgi:hypothetical protein
LKFMGVLRPGVRARVHKPVLWLALVAVLGTAGPAAAAPPGNDDPAGALPLALGRTVEDTTQAAGSALESTVASSCGSPVANAGVWYSFTAPADGVYGFNLDSSSYSGTILVFDGVPDESTGVACGHYDVAFDAVAGTTYTVLVIDDGGRGSTGNGGRLVINAAAQSTVPAPVVSLDPRARVDRRGAATFTGTYRCSSAYHVDIQAYPDQKTRSSYAYGLGAFEADLSCDGSVHRFAVRVVSDGDPFRVGDVTVSTYGVSRGVFGVSPATKTSLVHLTRLPATIGRPII